MTCVNVRDARARFAELLDSARNGQTIAITRRGRTIAVVGPPPEPTAVPLPDLRALHRRIKVKGKPLSQTVIELRRQARY